ncbi:Uncharacterised protein [Providencia stuartii]|nr:Uncharacterised protein [Providencia stuartii]
MGNELTGSGNKVVGVAGGGGAGVFFNTPDRPPRH